MKALWRRSRRPCRFRQHRQFGTTLPTNCRRSNRISMLHVATPSPRLLQQRPLCGMPPWISFRAATSCRPLRSHVTGDTLGWVEFADGNVDKALKYILAAWQLSEGAEVADHLGQIYAKRGDTEKAEYFYAVSLNARRRCRKPGRGFRLSWGAMRK